jgi:hypothetical protein
VARLGGFGVAAHTNSPTPDLAWGDWSAPFDGLEWLNLDTTWRMNVRQRQWRARWNLLEALFAYPFRHVETIARMTTGTALDAARWASISHMRKVVILGGTDAHSNLPFGFPAYESLFRTMSLHVSPEQRLAGDAAADAAAVIRAIRRGHVYTVVDGFAGPPAFQFTASTAQTTVSAGDALDGNAPMVLHVRSNAPSSFTTTLLQDDRPIATVPGNVELTRSVSNAPAVYRVEIDVPSQGGVAAWLLSNPIYAGLTFPPTVTLPRGDVDPLPVLFDGRSTAGWVIESDGRSRGTIDIDATDADPRGPGLIFHYELTDQGASSRYVSIVRRPLNVDALVDQLSFNASADRPMRIVVAVRNRNSELWARSVYLDTEPSEHVIRFDEMRPFGATRSPRPIAVDINEVFFEVEAVHTRPGSRGWLRIASAAFRAPR